MAANWIPSARSRRRRLAPGPCRSAARAPSSARSARRASSARPRIFHHRHPPTGWTSFDGPLRPRAFDLSALNDRRAASPWDAPSVLSNNPHCRCASGSWPRRCRLWRATPTATSCCSSMKARAICSAISAISPIATATISTCRAARCGGCRRERRATALLIEATNGHFTLPERGCSGPHAIFDPGDARHAGASTTRSARSRTSGRVAGRGQTARRRSRPSPIPSIRSMRWAGTAIWRRCGSTGATSGPVMSHRYHLPPSVAHDLRRRPLRGLHLRAAAVRERSRGAARCRSSTTTTISTR